MRLGETPAAESLPLVGVLPTRNCKSQGRISKRDNGISVMGILQDQSAISHHRAPHRSQKTDNISQRETPQVLARKQARGRVSGDGRYSQRHLKI